jgi:hypothetical protein
MLLSGIETMPIEHFARSLCQRPGAWTQHRQSTSQDRPLVMTRLDRVIGINTMEKAMTRSSQVMTG